MPDMLDKIDAALTPRERIDFLCLISFCISLGVAVGAVAVTLLDVYAVLFGVAFTMAVSLLISYLTTRK